MTARECTEFVFGPGSSRRSPDHLFGWGTPSPHYLPSRRRRRLVDDVCMLSKKILSTHHVSGYFRPWHACISLLFFKSEISTYILNL